MQLGAQGIKRRVEGLAQPGNVELPEGLGRSVQRDQLIAEAAMLEAVVQVEFAGGETLAELSIDPEFIAVPRRPVGLPSASASSRCGRSRSGMVSPGISS